MNIEIKSRSIWVLGHWKATDHFRAHIYSVEKTQFHTLLRVQIKTLYYTYKVHRVDSEKTFISYHKKIRSLRYIFMQMVTMYCVGHL